MKAVVLGCGNMSRAIIEGMSGAVDFSETYFYTPSQSKAKSLAAQVKGRFAAELTDLPTDPDVVILGCKPQQFAELSKLIKGKFHSDPLYLSILAATPLSLHESLLGSKKILRVMPNMSVRFKKGISILLDSDIPEVLKIEWEKNFALIGKVKRVKTEEQFNHLMLLCGSGPAFMYQWLKWLSVMSEDLTMNEREELAIAVMEGALETMRNDSSKSLETLISEVTSKGGVTAAVLSGWSDESIQGKLQAGWDKGIKRTEEIEKIILSSV